MSTPLPCPAQHALWGELSESDDGVPLVKILSEMSRDAPAQYQCKHLSFQARALLHESRYYRY